MLEIFMDALIDTAKMIPLLLIIYIGIELLEYKFGNKIRDKVKGAGKAGPLIGAAFGCVPQCGFSVISTALYSKRLITIGTLMAVYLSTSDEAIPVILAQPDKLHIIIPLLVTKVIIAIAAGFSIDFVYSRLKKYSIVSEVSAAAETDISENNHEDEHLEVEKGCCGHSCTVDKPNIKELFVHPAIHTFKIFLFIFAVTLLLNIIIYMIGEKSLSRFMLGHSIFQPVLTALIGLIPNCAASVVITQIFLKGSISFGSAIAGLCSSAGLGIIVLLKENHNKRDTFKIIGLLLSISIFSGILIQCFYG